MVPSFTLSNDVLDYVEFPDEGGSCGGIFDSLEITSRNEEMLDFLTYNADRSSATVTPVFEGISRKSTTISIMVSLRISDNDDLKL